LATFVNTWTGGIPIPAPVSPINPSYILPTGEIGFAWRLNFWVDGRPIYDALGAGIAPVLYHNATLQYGATQSDIYLTLPTGQVVWLQTATGTWTPLGG
jgi:hypothetical protein